MYMCLYRYVYIYIYIYISASTRFTKQMWLCGYNCSGYSLLVLGILHACHTHARTFACKSMYLIQRRHLTSISYLGMTHVTPYNMPRKRASKCMGRQGTGAGLLHLLCFS